MGTSVFFRKIPSSEAWLSEKARTPSCVVQNLRGKAILAGLGGGSPIHSLCPVAMGNSKVESRVLWGWVKVKKLISPFLPHTRERAKEQACSENDPEDGDCGFPKDIPLFVLRPGPPL